MNSAVLVGVTLGRFSRVASRMFGVPMRDVGVMTALFVISTFVMLCTFKMLFRRVLVACSRPR